jgi:hypothetical protein
MRRAGWDYRGKFMCFADRSGSIELEEDSEPMSPSPATKMNRARLTSLRAEFLINFPARESVSAP